MFPNPHRESVALSHGNDDLDYYGNVALPSMHTYSSMMEESAKKKCWFFHMAMVTVTVISNFEEGKLAV